MGKAKTQDLQSSDWFDKHNLGAKIPHQCQQRFRVSNERQKQGKNPTKTTKQPCGWQAKLNPNVNRGIPNVLMLVEPRVVWDHINSYDDGGSSLVEAQYCRTMFLNGFHQKASLAHGVYEGSYWALMKQCHEMRDFLLHASHPPTLLEEPKLILPPAPDLPAWSEFIPDLEPLPDEPKAAPVTLPIFCPPESIHPDEFKPPQLTEVPEPLSLGPDEAIPDYQPPDNIQIWEFNEPELAPIDPPQLPAEPIFPQISGPEYGHDWTSERPYQIPEPIAEEPQLVPVFNPAWRRPRIPQPHTKEILGQPPAKPKLVEVGPLILPDAPATPARQADYGPIDLEDMPLLLLPEELPMPQLVRLNAAPPAWVPPRIPKPIGFISSSAPVILFDVSGTLHPARGGQFESLKSCVSSLLDLHGEVTVACQLFDVIAFSTTAWSWSSNYTGRQKILESTCTPYYGRQAGRSAKKCSLQTSIKIVPGESVVTLRPTEETYLKDAQQWVAGWPQARGQTKLMPALLLAMQHTCADSLLLFSDGLVDDAVDVAEFLGSIGFPETQKITIHTVGFFPHSRSKHHGEKFLKYVAQLCGGTYQIYDPAGQWVLHDADVFESDLANESKAMQAERQWIEEKLSEERKRNRSLGIKESIRKILCRVKEMHAIERVLPYLEEMKLLEITSAREHELQCAVVHKENQSRKEQAMLEHNSLKLNVEKRNQEKIQKAEKTLAEKNKRIEDLHHHAVARWRQECDRIKEQHRALERERDKVLSNWEDEMALWKSEFHRLHSKELEAFAAEAVGAYADSFFKDVILRGAIPSVANQLSSEAYTRNYQANLEQVRSENDRTRQLHIDECTRRNTLEEQYGEDFRNWEKEKSEIERKHKLAVEERIAEHEEQVKALFTEWEKYAESTRLANTKLHEEAEHLFNKQSREIMERNARKHLAEKRRQDERQSTINENKKITEAAQCLHREHVKDTNMKNRDLLAQAKKQFKELCSEIEIEHKKKEETAIEKHRHLAQAVEEENEMRLKHAQDEYKQVCADIAAGHEDACRELLENHKVLLKSVREHNEGVAPEAHMAMLAKVELDRLQLFLEHIEMCGRKLCVGINFHPDTPNIFRVVENQALEEALEKAFPGIDPFDYPWPDAQYKLEPGKGWTTIPPPQPPRIHPLNSSIFRPATAPDSKSGSRKMSRRPKSAKPELQSSPLGVSHLPARLSPSVTEMMAKNLRCSRTTTNKKLNS